jgi:hypothetical protein
LGDTWVRGAGAGPQPRRGSAPVSRALLACGLLELAIRHRFARPLSVWVLLNIPPRALRARLISLLHQSNFYLAAVGEGEDSNQDTPQNKEAEMTLALTISIILSATVFTAIVGSLTWAIVTSRDGQATAPTKIKSLRERSHRGCARSSAAGRSAGRSAIRLLESDVPPAD